MPDEQAVIDSRRPLDLEHLHRQLQRPGSEASMWHRIETHASVTSTQDLLREAAAAGAGEGSVVIADEQRRGRGRLDRDWQSPPGAGIHASMLFTPGAGAAPVPLRRWGWLSLLAGVAAAAAIESGAGLPVVLKWPNDVLSAVAMRKIAGILAERTATAVILGIGINISLQPEEFPRSDAGSVASCGGVSFDRTVITACLLEWLEHWYRRWRAEGGDPDRSGLRAEYLQRCVTIGQPVRVELPGERFTGQAADLGEDGGLLVRTEAGQRLVSAGDVVHLRTTGR